MNIKELSKRYIEIFPDQYQDALLAASEWYYEINPNDYLGKIDEHNIARLDYLLELYEKNVQMNFDNHDIYGNYIDEYRYKARQKIDQSFEIIRELIADEVDGLIGLDYMGLMQAVEEAEERNNQEVKKSLREDDAYNRRF